MKTILFLLIASLLFACNNVSREPDFRMTVNVEKRTSDYLISYEAESGYPMDTILVGVKYQVGLQWVDTLLYAWTSQSEDEPRLSDEISFVTEHIQFTVKGYARNTNGTFEEDIKEVE